MKFNINFTKHKYAKLRVDLALILNTCGLGATKTVDKWKKVSCTIKAKFINDLNALARVTTIASYDCL